MVAEMVANLLEKYLKFWVYQKAKPPPNAFGSGFCKIIFNNCAQDKTIRQR